MADGILGSFLSGLGGFASTAGGALSGQVYQDQQVQQEQAINAKRQQIQQAAQTIVAGLQNGSIPQDQGNAALQRLNQAFQGAQIGPTPHAQEQQQQLQANQAFTKWLQGQQGGQGTPTAAPQGIQPSALMHGQPQAGIAPSALGGMPPSALTSPMGQNYIRALQAQKALEQTPAPTMVPIGKVNGVDMEQPMVQQSGQWTPIPGSQPRPVFKEDNKTSAFAKELIDGGIQPGSPEWSAAFKKRISRETSPTQTMINMSNPNMANPLSDPNTANFWFEYYDKYHQLPPMAWGTAGNPTREAFIKGFAGWAQQRGKSGADVAADIQQFKGQGAAYGQVTKDLNTLEPYNNMLHINGDIAIKLGQKIANTNAAFVNKPINWLKQNATNNPDISEYLFQINAMQNEASRVLSNPRLVGQMSYEAKKDMEAVFNGNLPIPAAERVIKRMQLDGGYRVEQLKKQQSGLGKQLGEPAGKKTQIPEATAPSAPKVVDFGSLK